LIVSFGDKIGFIALYRIIDISFDFINLFTTNGFLSRLEGISIQVPFLARAFSSREITSCHSGNLLAAVKEVDYSKK
jgi:hypothetical protein